VSGTGEKDNEPLSSVTGGTVFDIISSQERLCCVELTGHNTEYSFNIA
jgi:hypothetical protein